MLFSKISETSGAQIGKIMKIHWSRLQKTRGLEHKKLWDYGNKLILLRMLYTFLKAVSSSLIIYIYKIHICRTIGSFEPMILECCNHFLSRISR